MSFTVVKDSYPNIVKDGLVLNVDAGSRLSYSGSGTTWSDISGRGNNGTLTNGPTYSATNGGSIVFDGTNDWVNLGTATSLGFSSVRTISCWVNTLTTGTYILGLWDLVVGVNQRTFGLYVDASTSTFASIWSPDGVNDPAVLYDTTNVQLNTWYNLVCIFRSGVRELWKNGVLVSSLSQAAIYTSASTSRLGFGALPGRSSDTPVAFFNGRGASVQLYNRALSAEEILQNYNALLPRFYSIVTSGLVLNLDAGNPNSYSPPRSDQYASSLVLAVPMNGANNGTTFTDQSAIIKGSGTAKAITRNGDTKTLTAQSKFYGSSGFFDGTGDYLSCVNSSDFELGNGSFTLEAFVYANSWSTTNGGAGIISKGNVTSLGGDNYTLQVPNGIPQLFVLGSSGTYFTPVVNSNTTLSVNTWYHIAVTRGGNNTRIFIDGVLKATSTENYTISSGGSLYVGTQAYNPGQSDRSHNGYIQDVRVYKGVAKYTTNFKPPSISSGVTISSASGGVPILNTTDDYGTVNGSSGTTWTDISGNGNTGTLTNGPTYNGANYGSIAFDGGDDYISIGSQSLVGSGTSPFSVELWFYNTKNWTSGQYSMPIRVKQDSEFFVSLYNPSGTLNVYATFRGYNQWGIPVTQSTYVNTWICLSVVYNGGDKNTAASFITYVNGVQLASGTNNFGAAGGVSNCNLLGADGTSGCNAALNFYQGNISAYKVYNRALSAAEVSQNYNALKWRYGI